MKDIIKFLKPHTINNQVKVTLESVNPDTALTTVKLGVAHISLDFSSVLEKTETGYVLPDGVMIEEPIHLVIEKNKLKLMSVKQYKEHSKPSRRSATTSGSTPNCGPERF